MDSATLKRLQQTVNEVLFVVDDFCNREKIPYYLFYGSELGAVRHGGFIPWDDDADIILFRKDYERLKERWQKNPPAGYFWQDTETDPDYNVQITKIRKNHTAFVEPAFRDRKMHHGFYVDIFILDDYIRSDFWRHVGEWITMFDYNACRNYRPRTGIGRWVYPITNRLFRSGKIRKRWYQKWYPRFKKDDALCSDILSFTNSHRYDFRREWFGVPKKLFYEGRLMPCPQDTHNTLKVCYGDYLTPPPPEQRTSHHYVHYMSFDSDYDACGGTK